MYKQDLALDNLQGLIGHKNERMNKPTNKDFQKMSKCYLFGRLTGYNG